MATSSASRQRMADASRRQGNGEGRYPRGEKRRKHAGRHGGPGKQLPDGSAVLARSLLLHLLGGFMLGFRERLELARHRSIRLRQAVAVLVEVELLDERAAPLPVGLGHLRVLVGLCPCRLGFLLVVGGELLV